MLEVIEKLLVLQDRDRKITRLRSELYNIGPETAGASVQDRRFAGGHSSSSLLRRFRFVCRDVWLLQCRLRTGGLGLKRQPFRPNVVQFGAEPRDLAVAILKDEQFFNDFQHLDRPKVIGQVWASQCA